MMMDEKLEAKKKTAFSAGVVIIVLLAMFTIGEFWIGAIAHSWWQPLMLIALLKAFFVVRDYMHLPRMFAGDQEEHS
jgi:hypothetical protein